ncbi:serine beta-lactamase-like protein LACTB, mitochondrial isoform X2 [Oppia nitens]|uniref:serine beta-lactamase-like protein LACTB, mitochondrial isoform X2 n=1 Tax=Oppia nitens TaxID=1686743 RepID=UPI0023D9895B|nr:serine beta-lactamase-like protein LACTB, mitochondrial isoform X2 [Oppia nitens]
MFRHLQRKVVLAIGVAVGSGAATLVTLNAKSANSDDTLKVDQKNGDKVSDELVANNLKPINGNDNGQDVSRGQDIINSCVNRLSQWRQINGIPGIVVGVSLRGQNVWVYSEGFADIENGVKCNDRTVMRIASISKSMTSALLAKLLQEGKLDLDQPISQYLTKDQFPDKFWDGKKVDITLRQLASHLGGIRHYKKGNNNNNKNTTDDYKLAEFSVPEYYLKETFPSVTESLKLFKDDPLVAKPGEKYNYTTFGYTLISAVIESQLNGEKFEKYLVKFLRNELGLEHTYLDQNDPIIYNRSHFYVKNENSGRMQNAPYVDNSYKWAGGGLLSNVYDLLKFGNIMLYSYKGGTADGKPGFIRKDIVDQMWTPLTNTRLDWDTRWGGYGLGWGVIRGTQSKFSYCSEPMFSHIFSHTGGAIGASSVILIEPNNELVVTIITNLQQVGAIYEMGLYIAQQFTN